jgi:putative ABC transport system ATP-binding protein
MMLLEARALCKIYRAGTKAEVRAVEDISFTVSAGSFVVIRGASGSGKTTLLALLGILARPTRGDLVFQERFLSACSDVERTRIRRQIGFIFQSFSLIPGLPIWENITYPLIPLGVPSSVRQRRAHELLDQLGIADKFNALPEELSGGEQQRVAIARALVAKPKLVIADEPTSNLDPATAGSIISFLRDLHTQGTTLIVASHDPQIIDASGITFELRSGRGRFAVS